SRAEHYLCSAVQSERQQNSGGTMKSRHRRWPAAAAMLLYFTTRVQAAITISPTALPPWTVNIVYSQTLTASGCLILVGCSWSVTAGSLPTGLSLEPPVRSSAAHPQPSVDSNSRSQRPPCW